MSLLRKFWHSFVFVALFCPFTSHGKTLACNQFLSSENDTATIGFADQFVSYLAVLYEARVISLENLYSMVKELEQKKPLNNPLAEDQTRSEDNVHSEYLEAYIKSEFVDKDKLLILLNNFLKMKDNERKNRKASEEKTSKNHLEIEWHPVKGGNFKLKEIWMYKDEEKQTRIDHDFEVMSTPVTLLMWKKVMGSLPLEYSPNQQSDFPIGYVTIWSIMEFANRLSIVNGFEPAYDYKNVFQFGGSAIDGTLKAIRSNKLSSKEFEKKVMEIFRESLKKKGYRLPTFSEQHYLLTDRGRSKSDFFTGINENNVSNFAWYKDNSGDLIHPVAELGPLKIDGYKFYDLFGNVLQVCFSEQKNELQAQGGAYQDDLGSISNTGLFAISELNRGESISFRLVRTLP